MMEPSVALVPKQAYFTKKARIKIFKSEKRRGEVSLHPTLKDGVFVTLCAPLVINFLP
jgi:hypothetical protein